MIHLAKRYKLFIVLPWILLIASCFPSVEEEILTQPSESERPEGLAQANTQFPMPGQLVSQVDGSQIDIYSSPSISSDSPHYGLNGDRVTVTDRFQTNGDTWYSVEFTSGATGWVPSSSISFR